MSKFPKPRIKLKKNISAKPLLNEDFQANTIIFNEYKF